MNKLKKIVISLIFFLWILCGCTQSASGNVDELCGASWSKTLEGGAAVSLRFEGNNCAYLTVESAGECTEIAGKYIADENQLVIFMPSLAQNYGFHYLPKGDELELSSGGRAITLEKQK